MALFFGVQGTNTHVHVCSRFEADLWNNVQNFPWKPQNITKYAYFPTLKKSPKIEKKKKNGPKMHGTTVSSYVYTMGRANLLNDV